MESTTCPLFRGCPLHCSDTIQSSNSPDDVLHLPSSGRLYHDGDGLGVTGAEYPMWADRHRCHTPNSVSTQHDLTKDNKSVITTNQCSPLKNSGGYGLPVTIILSLYTRAVTGRKRALA